MSISLRGANASYRYRPSTTTWVGEEVERLIEQNGPHNQRESKPATEAEVMESDALALRSPAFTRSTIKLRSSSATAPRTVKTILPAGVDVSSDSDNETK